MATRKKKLDSLPKIRRRIMSLWSLKVREVSNFTCMLCGAVKGTVYTNEKGNVVKLKIDAHHLISRDIKDSFLRYNIINGVAVCPHCHKWGNYSFHRDPVNTMKWLMENKPEAWEYLIKYREARIDLDNRKVLEEIERTLKEGLPLDLEKIQEIERLHPRKAKQPVFAGSLFDQSEKSSSSSFE